MIKTVTMLKRRPGMSVEEFRAYYESRHRLIGEKYLKGNAVKYQRRFLTPAGRADAPIDAEYDVLLEIWYADREAYRRTMTVLTAPDAAKEIADDEARLFDDKRASYVVDEECQSVVTE